MITRIEGIDQIQRDLSNFPINAEKVVGKAMRKGGNAVAARMRREIDGKFRKAVKSKLYSKGSGSYVLVGLFKGKDAYDADRDYIPTFFKGYWHNYGTLSRRDPSHQFTYPRRTSSKNRKGGIKPHGWFEKLLPSAQSAFVPAMQAEYNKLIEKVFANGTK